jgi:hypothetical protein
MLQQDGWFEFISAAPGSRTGLEPLPFPQLPSMHVGERVKWGFALAGEREVNDIGEMRPEM